MSNPAPISGRTRPAYAFQMGDGSTLVVVDEADPWAVARAVDPDAIFEALAQMED